eukprot:gnl/TRDRNA2_/TRDRNA2_84729_c0_seq1.p1 gnl/TRDRNA2_/TRDRNA2_84729_c0~~gnl/TRDRNA2_/TRDRNA2_84729_c0_seq1.p1  ORF type:complete len:425 (-),score=57.19 gnl/TRDRNA2_/TRDRNA2_84729_c0_seq1:63-1337(-)
MATHGLVLLFAHIIASAAVSSERGGLLRRGVRLSAQPLQKDELHLEQEATSAVEALRPKTHDGRKVLTVALMNGLGNQLFQVATLLAVGLEHQSNFSVVLPNVPQVCCNRSTYWNSVFRKLQPLLGPRSNASVHIGANGKPLRPEGGHCVVEQVPGFDPWDKKRACGDATAFSGLSLASRLTRSNSTFEQISGCNKVTLYGYFQNSSFFARHLPVLRQLFWDDGSAKKAAARLASLVPDDTHKAASITGSSLTIPTRRLVVSIHYRLGDYDPQGWVLEPDYYNQGLDEVRTRLPGRNVTCLIFSDQPDRAWMHSALLSGCDARVLVPKGIDDITSLYMMSLTEASVLADSSFSYWAALLGSGQSRRKKVVVAPQMGGKQSVCFSYLSVSPAGYEEDWIAVATDSLSPQQLFAQEIIGYANPDDF